jgi:hypothetical protein
VKERGAEEAKLGAGLSDPLFEYPNFADENCWNGAGFPAAI